MVVAAVVSHWDIYLTVVDAKVKMKGTRVVHIMLNVSHYYANSLCSTNVTIMLKHYHYYAQNYAGMMWTTLKGTSNHSISFSHTKRYNNCNQL